MPPAPEAAVIDQHLLEHSLTVSKQFADYLGSHGMHDREKVRESGAVRLAAACTGWEILHEAGIDPAPERSPATWAGFLRSQGRSPAGL